MIHQQQQQQSQQKSIDHHHHQRQQQQQSCDYTSSCYNNGIPPSHNNNTNSKNLHVDDDDDDQDKKKLQRGWKMNVNGMRWSSMSNNTNTNTNYCTRLISTIAASNDNNEKGGGNGSSSSCCESSLSFNCSCKRIPMIAFLLLIIFIFLFCNISLFVQVNSHLLDLMYPPEYNGIVSKNRKYDENLLSFKNKKSGLLKEYIGRKRLSYQYDQNGNRITSGKSGSSKGSISNKNKSSKKQQQQQQENTILPNPTSLLKNATFSACLLIKDDNEILNEWIAYHYHTVHLRQLIVAVDPTSSESPTLILNKWRNITNSIVPQYNEDGVPNELRIVEWYDEDYMPNEFIEAGRAPIIISNASDLTNIADIHNPELQNETILLQISNHRYRQRVFLAQCLREFRFYYNLSWVVHIDTDEYIVASKLLRQMKPLYVDVPNSTESSGSVLRLIQQTVARTYQLVGYPCISMLRVLFGSVESTKDEIYYDQVPTSFNATNFETLRWRYHALPHNMTLHGNPKVILDVSVIPEDYFPQNIVYSIHRPVKEVCPKNKEIYYTNFRKQPIGTNHYLGSWERYNSRNDKRRSRSVYDLKATVKRGKDDFAGTWLKGFVNNVGYDIASHLLNNHYLMNEDNTESLNNQSIITETDMTSSSFIENKDINNNAQVTISQSSVVNDESSLVVENDNETINANAAAVDNDDDADNQSRDNNNIVVADVDDENKDGDNNNVDDENKDSGELTTNYQNDDNDSEEKHNDEEEVGIEHIHAYINNDIEKEDSSAIVVVEDAEKENEENEEEIEEEEEDTELNNEEVGIEHIQAYVNNDDNHNEKVDSAIIDAKENEEGKEEEIQENLDGDNGTESSNVRNEDKDNGDENDDTDEEEKEEEKEGQNEEEFVKELQDEQPSQQHQLDQDEEQQEQEQSIEPPQLSDEKDTEYAQIE